MKRNRLYQLLKPLLFRLDGELSHKLTISLLDAMPFLISPLACDKPITIDGLTFKNQVCIAAGMVKNAEALIALSRLGVGAIEVGTITPQQQPGNTGIRIFRDLQRKALVNRLGFNNQGFLLVRERIAKSKKILSANGTLVGVNLGKQKSTSIEEAARDYNEGLRFFYNIADYFTLNFSSPNTEELRSLQYGNLLEKTIHSVTQFYHSLKNQARTPRQVTPPLFIKIAPELSKDELRHLIEVCGKEGITTIIATNTLKSDQGGVSGEPLAKLSIKQLVAIKNIAPEMNVISSGGIMSAAEAMRRLHLGAHAIQLYSGLIFEGPDLVAQIYDQLAGADSTTQ